MKQMIGFLLQAFVFANCFGQQQSDTKPNIIYIMADDMGYADLSCYGRKDYQTPNLDKLASEGLKFTNAYAAAPVCTPTRTGFMTGRYPARIPVGLREPLRQVHSDSLIGLSSAYPSIATLLRKNGYETILIGKWHLGFLLEFGPLQNGFDEFFGFRSGASDYISHTGDNRQNDLFENDKPVKKDGYLTDLFAERAIEFISRQHSKPFFLSLQFNAPHWPWQGPGDKAYPDTMNLRNGGSPQTFAEMVINLDVAVGKILKALDQNKISSNTVIIFTSDNGGERFSDMGILKGKKLLLWEGGIRVPAFIRWPGKIKAGITDQPLITMDWSATILDLANAKPSTQFPLDGESLVPLCLGKMKEFERTFYWRVFQRNKQKAIRHGIWKYLQDEQGEYLFDLSIDPGEKNNLKEKEKKIFEQLKENYRLWESSVLKPVPLEN